MLDTAQLFAFLTMQSAAPVQRGLVPGNGAEKLKKVTKASGKRKRKLAGYEYVSPVSLCSIAAYNEKALALGDLL